MEIILGFIVVGGLVCLLGTIEEIPKEPEPRMIPLEDALREIGVTDA